MFKWISWFQFALMGCGIDVIYYFTKPSPNNNLDWPYYLILPGLGLLTDLLMSKMYCGLGFAVFTFVITVNTVRLDGGLTFCVVFTAIAFLIGAIVDVLIHRDRKKVQAQPKPGDSIVIDITDPRP